MIGQVLSGSYRLTDLVGSGGYADVYLGRDLRSNTIVAVKILHPTIARDRDAAGRFEREATLARRLQTPYVARVLDSGQDPGSPPYIVMEYIQGLTLAELMRRRGPFPVPEAARVVGQLLSALGAAHALGIVHRDIKPQNLMIDAEGRLKVLDFGVARIAGAGTMTSSGHLLGTPEYMAAEQVSGGPVDHRADLYAAGVVLYQLLTGRAPFVRSSDGDIWALIHRVRTELPTPIRQLRPDVPPALAAVVDRAMLKDPNWRFQSAQEMREALAAAASIEPPSPAGRETRILPPRPDPVPPPWPAPHPPGPAPRPPGPVPRPVPPPPVPPPPVPPPPGPGSAGSSPPLRQIAAAGAGILLLAVLGVALGQVVPLPSGSPTPTPLPVAVATASPALADAATVAPTATPVPPTATPAPPTATAAPPTATGVPPSPTRPPAPTTPPGVLLADTFDHAETGRLPRTSSRPNDYTFTYDAGEYVISKLNPALAAAPVVFVPGTYDDSILAIDVRLVGPAADRYAFVTCRDQTNASQPGAQSQPGASQTRQYRASLVPAERRLILTKWDTTGQRVLGEVTNDPAIRSGNDANRLELRCAGRRIAAAVNGRDLVSADDLTYPRGEHGLGIGTYSGVTGTIEARFDNLEVRQP